MWGGFGGSDGAKKTPAGSEFGGFGRTSRGSSNKGTSGSSSMSSVPTFGSTTPFGSSSSLGGGKFGSQGAESEGSMQKSTRVNPFSNGGSANTGISPVFGSSSSQSKQMGVAPSGGGSNLEGKRSGGKNPAFLSSKDKAAPSCRVCGSTFASFDELKGHIRREGHHSNSKDNQKVGLLQI